AARRPCPAGRRLRASRRLRGREPGKAARRAQGADGHRLSGDAGDRPRLFLRHLFPHSRRRAVRGRDQRARLRPRRGHRPSRRGAEAAAPARAPAAVHRAAARADPGLRPMARDSYIHRIEPGEAGGPLRFVFHGTGADETQFLGLGHALMPAASVIAPRGDVSEHGAARYFRRTGEGVYDMDDLARATDRMAAFVAAHRDADPPSAVVGLGYSNGANILASMLFARPGLFDAAVLMHPLIPFEPDDAGSLAGTRVL